MTPKKLLKQMLFQTLWQAENKIRQAQTPKQSLQSVKIYEGAKNQLIDMFGKTFIQRRLAVRKLKFIEEKQKNWSNFKELKYWTNQKINFLKYCEEIFKPQLSTIGETLPKQKKIKKNKKKVRFVTEKNQYRDI